MPLHEDPELSVRMTFGERSAWFMFDTGAGSHTFARWFVDASGLHDADSPGETVPGHDAGGESIEFSIIRNVEGRLPDGTSLTLDAALVADFPTEFQDDEFGGLLNPQLLAGTDRAVVLDLRVPELRIEQIDQTARVLAAEAMGDDHVQTCSSAAAPLPNLLHAVLVASRGQTTWLQLDTGSGETAVLRDNPIIAGLQLESGGETMGVAGRPRSYAVARDLTISFAGYRTTVHAQVVDRTHGGACGPDGLLGRDALAGCALVFSRGSVAITCA